MNKVALLPIVVLTALLVTQNANADDRNLVRLEGVISEIGDRGIVLHTRGSDRVIQVTADTLIMRNGERVRFGALKVRDHANVVAKIVRRGDHRHLVARGISARGK